MSKAAQLLDLLLFDHLDDGELVELRAILGEESSRAFYDSQEKALAWAKKHATARNIYFGVAPRFRGAGGKKDSVSRVLALWADIDIGVSDEADKQEQLDLVLASFILAPTAVVDSGRGLHLYWRIEQTTDFEAVEQANKAIADLLSGDDVSDRARILRVPGTFNHKQDEPLTVKVLDLNKAFIYKLQDVTAALEVSEKIANRVAQESHRGYQSRSERDFAVVMALVEAGLSEQIIEQIFLTRPCGARVRERGGTAYLARTLKRARNKAAKKPKNKWGFLEKNQCYWKLTPTGGTVQLSTFVFQPQVLLHGLNERDPDVLMGTMEADGHSWNSVRLTRKAFVSAEKLIGELPLASWQWLGSNADARALLPYLVERLKEAGMKKRAATTVVGRTNDMFVTPAQTIDATGVLDADSAPLVYMPTAREAPDVDALWPDDADFKKTLLKFMGFYRHINEPEVIWPALGWFVASLFKPILEAEDIRFPILNLFGTRGSGKTTLLLKVLQPLVGYSKPRAYDCNTTNFVLLSLLGSSNAIPVSLAEYRQSSLKHPEAILRYLLLSYDSGYDARGKSDQTTVGYPLSAPFTLDGEDGVNDPAALERVVQINMHPEFIAEGTDAYKAFHELEGVQIPKIAGRLLHHSLTTEPKWEQSMKMVREAFPQVLPDRVRRNLAVVVVGLLAWEDFIGGFDVDVDFLRDVLSPCLSNVLNLEAGRTPILADEFATDVLNYIAMDEGDRRQFEFKLAGDGGQVWIQISPALKWWLVKRRREGLPTLQESALKSQLKERTSANGVVKPGQYFIASKRMSIRGGTRWVGGIDVKAAADAGLDVPDKLTQPFSIQRGSDDDN
jgi:hypothetical protein